METTENAPPLPIEDYWARVQALREQLAAARGHRPHSTVWPGGPRPVTHR